MASKKLFLRLFEVLEGQFIALKLQAVLIRNVLIYILDKYRNILIVNPVSSRIQPCAQHIRYIQVNKNIL